MYSYIIYNSILFFSFLFSFIAEYGKGGKNFLRILVFITLWLPAAIRYEVGVDYNSYVEIYEGIRPNLINELGFLYIQNVLQWIGCSVQWLFVMTSFIMYVPLCLALKQQNYCSIISFYVLFVYFSSLGFIRQFLAVSCLVYSLYNYLYTYDNKKCYWGMILSLMFHYSALCYLIVFFLFRDFRIGIKRMLVIIVLFYGLIISIDFVPFLFKSVAIFIPSYGAYIDSIFNAPTPLGTGLGVLSRLLIPFCVLLNADKLINKNNRNSLLVILNLIYILVNILAVNIFVFVRLNELFLFVLPFSFAELLKIRFKYKKIVMSLICILSIILFEKNILLHFIYPYQCLWD